MRNRILLWLITVSLLLTASGISFGQSEWVKGDTSLIMLNGGAFLAPQQNGPSLSLNGEIFGRLNIGYTHSWWNTEYFVSFYTGSGSKGHHSDNGYLEVLPLRSNGRNASASLGIALLVGNNSGVSYQGYAGTAYLNLSLSQSVGMILRLSEARINPGGRQSNFGQTSFGGGIGLRAGKSVMLTATIDRSQGNGVGVTTISGGLALLIPRQNARNQVKQP